jgi:hypothetical protein
MMKPAGINPYPNARRAQGRPGAKSYKVEEYNRGALTNLI